jgi:hypothetical protein
MKKFGMFTDEGNAAVHEMLATLHARMEREDRGACVAALIEGIRHVEKAHPEVTDTMVREIIAVWVQEKLGFNLSIFDFV